MKEKIIAIDLDGTLAQDNAYLSEYTIQEIKKLSSQGYKIVITTGRTWLGTKDIYNACQLKTPVVLYNGAYVFIPATGQVLNDVRIEKSFIESLLKQSDFLNLIDNVFCQYQNQEYILNSGDKITQEMINSFLESMTLNPTSLVLKVKNNACQYVMKELIGKSNKYAYRHWGDRFGEVYHQYLSKKDGIEIVLDYYHATNEDLIFFGDAQNDVEILRYAKVGVAMKNAKEHIKKEADEITKEDNNHDGVVIHIQQKIQRCNQK